MRWLMLTLITLQAATCGQKGPLTLPDGARAAPPALAATVTPTSAAALTGRA